MIVFSKNLLGKYIIRFLLGLKSLMTINGSRLWLRIALHSTTPISIKIGMFGVRPCNVSITLMGLSLDYSRVFDCVINSNITAFMSSCLKLSNRKTGFFTIQTLNKLQQISKNQIRKWKTNNPKKRTITSCVDQESLQIG